MVSLAKENLLHEKSKVTLSIAGVVLGVFLIFTTVGLYNGLDRVVESMTLESGADLWVTSKGASGSLHSPSLLPTGLDAALSGIEGVEKVAPLIRMPVAVTLDDTKYLIYLTGYDAATGLGGPWSVVEGKDTPGPGEMVIDQVLSRKTGLGVGDEIVIEGRGFRIAGISDETFILIAYLAFVNLEDAVSFLPADLTNFYLVKTVPGVPPEDVQTRIAAAFPDVSASLSQVNATEAKDETIGGFLPIIFVISAIGILVGVLVVGLLVYTMTIEKSREYGIVRAIGGTNGYLYRIVLYQSMAVSVAGYVIGAAVSVPLIAGLKMLVPELVVTITPAMILWVFLIFVVTGLVASVIPVKRLSGIDPASVFKG
ncbi:MAG: ABC transporter permease [Dehalogenimonas sp.]